MTSAELKIKMRTILLIGQAIDQRHSRAVSAEFAPIALPVVVEYFVRLAKTGAIFIR